MKANNFNKDIFSLGIILILIGIILGAFGAHGLKSKINADQLNSFEVGIRYQIYHGLALLIIAVVEKHFNFKIKRIVNFMIFGVILFSGSIYILSCKDILNLTDIPKLVYLITPLGGVLLITSWILLLLNVKRKN